MQLITPSQCRAARALLNWSQPDLAARCDMNVQTISAFENETSTPTRRTLEKITETFISANIEFLEKDGLRRCDPEIKTYRGRVEFEQFIWEIYEGLKAEGGDICISNYKDSEWNRYLGWNDTRFEDKVLQLKNKKFSYKILIGPDEQLYFRHKWISYRYVDDKLYYTTPFYIYGDKFAIINFAEDVTVHVINNREIAEAQRNQFNVLWEKARPIA